MLLLVFIIAIISIAFAFRSLHQLEKQQEVEHAKKVLKKGKVIYYRDSSASSR